MAFVNTIEVMGQEAFINSFIGRTLTEFKDEYVTSIGEFAFTSMKNLEVVDIKSTITKIGEQSFMDCSALKAVILRSEEVPVDTFWNRAEITVGASWSLGTPIAKGTGFLYVPRALVTPYTNINYVGNCVRALEDHTVDGTTTGELDPAKI